jgi:LysM repeat protein
MKLIHVTGLVIAVHAAVFVVIFATPGCRSTGRPKPTPEDTAPASVTPVVDTLKPLPASNEGDLAATAVTPVVPVADSGGSSFGPADGTIRFAPSRPAPAPIVEATPAPAPSATHTVVKGDNLWSIARKYGITIDELAAANQLAKAASLRLGQTLSVPAKAAAPAVATGGEAANTYAVVSGDTLGSIARKHGTTATALRTANNLKGDALRIGQKLVIPGNALPASGDTVAPAPAPAPAARPAPRAGDGTHTVVPGDTLGSIARKHGVRVGDLATLNNITDPAKIRVGQSLRLPVGAKSAAAPAPAASADFTAPSPAAPVAPTPVTPVQPMAVPVIRID